MKFCFRFILTAVLIHGALCSNAQQQDEDIIIKAMQDELNRNISELKVPNLDKPFFIMYSIQDQKSYSISATMGSLSQSSESQQRFKSNTRVLVGDYSFNDESLEDNLFSSPTAMEIGLPLDADYLGIRRALWSTTDKVYRDAARHFEKHKETLKETGKALDDIPHRSFVKSPAVKLISLQKPSTFDKEDWEKRARNLSALYLKHSSIQNSVVIIQFVEGYNYIVSSEGTIAKTPFSLATFMSLGQSKNTDGEFSMERIIHVARTADGLPSEDQLAQELNKMIAKIENQSKTPKFDEEYAGPVLLIGSVVADLFSNVLFNGRENVMASDNIPKLKGFQYDDEMTSMDGKIGKSILNESITIKAKPKLKSFQNTDLVGSFEIDDEGIVPADELVIVEKGILRNLLNNRTITNSSQTANGFSSGPGVIEVTIALKNSEKVLKEKLIAQAKKEGLDFAIIVRDAPAFGMGLVNVYKVSVADGKEELLRNAILNSSNLKTLKRILGASENLRAYNLDPSNNRGGGGSSGLTSYIIPESILVEELEIRPFRMPSLKENEYVPSPLKQ